MMGRLSKDVYFIMTVSGSPTLPGSRSCRTAVTDAILLFFFRLQACKREQRIIRSPAIEHAMDHVF